MGREARRRKTITPAERDRLVKGGTLLMPGVWADAEDNIHFSVPDLLKAFGWPDDEKHRAMVMQTIEEICAQQFPDTPITDVDVES